MYSFNKKILCLTVRFYASINWGVCPEDVYGRRFPFSPNFRKFRSEIKWKGAFRFGSTGFFGITFEDSLIFVGKRPMSISLPFESLSWVKYLPLGTPQTVRSNFQTNLIGTHSTLLQHLASPDSSYAPINVNLGGGLAITKNLNQKSRSLNQNQSHLKVAYLI